MLPCSVDERGALHSYFRGPRIGFSWLRKLTSAPTPARRASSSVKREAIIPLSTPTNATNIIFGRASRKAIPTMLKMRTLRTLAVFRVKGAWGLSRSLANFRGAICSDAHLFGVICRSCPRKSEPSGGGFLAPQHRKILKLRGCKRGTLRSRRVAIDFCTSFDKTIGFAPRLAKHAELEHRIVRGVSLIRAFFRLFANMP